MEQRIGRPTIGRSGWALGGAGLLLAAPVAAQEETAEGAPPPPTDLRVSDVENDAGDKLMLNWNAPEDAAEVVFYVIDRKVLEPKSKQKQTATAKDKAGSKEPAAPEWKELERVPRNQTSYEDQDVKPENQYLYRVRSLSAAQEFSKALTTPEPVQSVVQYFNWNKAWYGILLIVVCGAVIYFTTVARQGRELKIRKIAGLDAVSEAVGRATEMGRACLFVPGIMDINDIQTVAGLTILSHVAESCASYEAKLEVPTARSLVMTAARESVQAAYLSTGRPDAYNEDNIYYVTDEQFGYVASVTGTMVREKPAACFYMGAFYAESLILAEMGNSVGAIQVAGTAQPSQLPFFVAACDYTLIGEEFFAASAYLSGEPHQLGSLKGQDVGKAIGGLLIVIGCLLATVAAVSKDPQIQVAMEFLRDNVLGPGGFWK